MKSRKTNIRSISYLLLLPFLINPVAGNPHLLSPLSAPNPERDERIRWHKEARFGSFIHWGVYSSLGNEFHGRKGWLYSEHIMRALPIPRTTYLEEVARTFNPVDFDADEWVKLMHLAGMKYLVITAKHHDGFAMYPSNFSSFDIANATSFGRDPMAELKAACDKYGMRFGFYYSHAFDWEHPDAPGNDWDYNNPSGDRQIGGREWWTQEPEFLNRARSYVDRKAIPQILELIDSYKPDIFWGDTPTNLPLEEELRMLHVIRAADPEIVVNSRFAPGFGDYKSTSDRLVYPFDPGGHWEGIPTTNESYAYSKHDRSHKPPSHFIKLLAQCVSKGGNMLLNIGPKGDGTIDEPDERILRSIGRWMDVYGESIHGCARSPLPVQDWGVSTLMDNKLYLHVFDWPDDGHLFLSGLSNNPTSIFHLARKDQRLNFERVGPSDILVSVKDVKPDPVNTVLVLEFPNPPPTLPARLIGAKGKRTVLHVFDGKLKGKGIEYGDGKQYKDVTEKWSNPGDSVSWQIRVESPEVYKVTLVYSTSSVIDVGQFTIRAGQESLSAKVLGTLEPRQFREDPVGQISLKRGTYPLTIEADYITRENLMRLQRVILEPLPE